MFFMALAKYTFSPSKWQATDFNEDIKDKYKNSVQYFIKAIKTCHRTLQT